MEEEALGQVLRVGGLHSPAQPDVLVDRLPVVGAEDAEGPVALGGLTAREPLEERLPGIGEAGRAARKSL